MVDFREGCDLSIALQGLAPVELHSCSGQSVALYRHPTMGHVLVINGEVQHVEAWQALYHEPLVHVPASFVTRVETALILGGGSLYAAREVLRYPTIRQCTLVDHNPRVIEMMARSHRHAQAVLSDQRFELVVKDACEFLKSCTREFDLIINDWVNLADDPEAREEDAISSMTNLLTCEGVCADVMYRHVFDREHVRRTKAALRPFQPTAYSLVTVPEYPGVLHLLTVWGSKYVDQSTRRPRNAVQRDWQVSELSRPQLEFYDPRFLAFYLYLPPYLKRLLVDL